MKKLECILGVCIISIAVSAWSGCTMQAKSKATVHFDLSELIDAAKSGAEFKPVEPMKPELVQYLEENLANTYASEGIDRDSEIHVSVITFPNTTTAPTPSPPILLSEFECFVANVMGPGIPQHGTIKPGEVPPDVKVARAALGAPIAYEGMTSQAFSLTSGVESTIDVTVPAGPARVVQIIGLRAISSTPGDPVYDYCHGTTTQLPHDVNGAGDGFFIVAQSFIPSAFGDIAVTMTQDYLTRPGWYQQYKRINGGNACKSFAGMFSTGTGTAVGTGNAFAIQIDSHQTGFTFTANRFLVELGNPTSSTTVSAALYVDSGDPSGVVLQPPSAAQVVNALNSVTIPAGAPSQTYAFDFPPTALPGNGTPAIKRSYLLLTSSNGSLDIMGEAAGVYNYPLVSALKYNASWSNITPGNPYISVERCY